jgi:hypothetical protein
MVHHNVPRKIKIDFETFVKRSWPVLAFGAVLIFLASAALVVFAVSGTGRKTPSVPKKSAASSTALRTDLVSRSLDGVLVSPSDANLQAYAVMVENLPEARPVSGLSKANLVFELPVEGGVTRYLTVFDATTTVEQIGPVRSARAYYVDLADGLNAAYAHVGGSPEALDKIKGLKSFRDLNEFWNGKYFWRSAKRSAPHNVYTRSDLLSSAQAANEWKVGKIQAWKYKADDPTETTSGTKRGSDNGPSIAYGGAYGVSWKFDRTADDYVRWLAGAAQKDADGTLVLARNVIVVETEWNAYDAVGRLKLRTTGKGKATVYRDGKKLSAIWKRTAGENFRFEGVDGSDVLLNRGTTWIEFTQGKMIDSAATSSDMSGASASSTK